MQCFHSPALRAVPNVKNQVCTIIYFLMNPVCYSIYSSSNSAFYLSGYPTKAKEAYIFTVGLIKWTFAVCDVVIDLRR